MAVVLRLTPGGTEDVVHPSPHLSGGNEDEEGHVGGAHHGVSDPSKDGDNTEERW